MTPADLYYQYIFGWCAGAGRKLIDTNRSEHKNEIMREAYAEGYSDGQEAGISASLKASEKYSYNPSLLKVRS